MDEPNEIMKPSEWGSSMASRLQQMNDSQLASAPSRPGRGLRLRVSSLLTDFNDVARVSRLLQKQDGANSRRSLLARWRGDLFGGMVAALIAVPYGMALSVAIGLPPEAGLYTSIIGGTVSGLLSKSPILISGLSATAVPILAVIVKNHGVGAALAVGFLSGLIMVAIGLLRLGRFANYLPQAIVSAFTTGLGLTIVMSQLKSLFNVVPGRAGFDLGIVDDIFALVPMLGLSDPRALIIGGIVMATMVLVPKWKENIPSSLIGVLLATIAASLFGFEMPRVGALPSGFPDPRMIELDMATLSTLIHPALTLAGLFTINQVLTAVVVDRVGNTSNSQKSNRELIAQGAANMVNPLFGAPPGVAMLARTVASSRAGAVSRFSIIAHSLILLLIIPLRGLVSHIPLAALAAVTVMVGLQLIDWKRFRSLGRMSRPDVVLFLLTFSLVVLSDLVVGVGIGFLIAMILFIERAAEATYLEAAPLPAVAAARVDFEAQSYRLVGPLFFATGEKVLRQLKTEVSADVLVLDMAAAGPIDSAASDLLRKIFQMQQGRGGQLFLTGLDKRLYSLCEKDGLIAEMGIAHFSLKPDIAYSVSDKYPRRANRLAESDV